MLRHGERITDTGLRTIIERNKILLNIINSRFGSDEEIKARQELIEFDKQHKIVISSFDPDRRL